MNKLKTFAIAGLLATSALTCAVAPHLASAQAPPTAAQPAPVFDAAAKRDAIVAAAKLLTDDYIYPDMGAKAAAQLTQNLSAGKYDAITTPAAFADQLTQDLQGLTHDKHMIARSDDQMRDTLLPSLPPPNFYGFVQADRLKGNVGYIKLDGFMPKPLSRQGADKVMGLLASTDALIIDMRGNDGGDPAAVSYLVSFFFDGKTPIHVNDIVWRDPGTTDYERHVFSTEPTPVSYLNKPVYLITGPHTISGGEEFAYDMQTLKRATLLGEATGGGANPANGQPIGPGLTLFVPSGRAENPITHTNWEGKGVSPDVTTPAAQSFFTTYSLAFQALGRPSPALADTPEAVTEAHLLVPPRTTPAPGSEAALRAWEAGMASGHPPYDIMSDAVGEMMKAAINYLPAQLSRRGALESVTFLRVDLYGADIYDLTFDNQSTLRFAITLGPDGKITKVMGQSCLREDGRSCAEPARPVGAQK